MNSPFNQTARYELTILVPVYNEEDNMRALSARLAAYLPAAKKHSCVLFINDGSTDKSGELIREACREHEHFFFLEFSRNCGLSAAIKAGMDKALSPYVAYIDADLQTAPEELDLLTPYLDEYELVTGVRAKRKDTAFKKFQSRVANGFRRMMVKDGARDTGCPLKVMHTDMARRLPFFKGMLAMRCGDNAAAHALFSEAAPLQPDDDAFALASFYAGYVLTLDGRWQEALPSLEAAFKRCPGMKEYGNLAGVALFKLERYEEAADYFSRVLRIDKGSAMDWANLGMCRKRSGRNDEARECLSTALSLDASLDFARRALDELNAAGQE